MHQNVLWYGVVRDYEEIFFQFTSTFFRVSNLHKPLKPTCTIPCVCAQHGHLLFIER